MNVLLMPLAADILCSVTPGSWDARFPQTRVNCERHNPDPIDDVLVDVAVTMWLEASRSGDPGDLVKEITGPTLLVRDDDDHLFSPRESIEFRELIANRGCCTFRQQVIWYFRIKRKSARPSYGGFSFMHNSNATSL